MKLEINKDWIIDFDGLQWMPKRLGVNAKGERTETVEGFCMSLPHAIEKIVKTQLGKREDTTSLDAFLKEYKELKSELMSSAISLAEELIKRKHRESHERSKS